MISKRVFWLFFLFTCFSINQVIAQSPNYFFIGGQELKGQDVYSISFHDNLLYASTNRGLYKFQYNAFTKLPFKDGKDKSIFEIKEDKNGVLFCKSLDGVIYKLEEDTLVPFFVIPAQTKTGIFYYFFTHKNELMIVAKGIHLVDNSGKLSHSFKEFKDCSTFYSHKISKDRIFISSNLEGGKSLIYSKGKFEKIDNQSIGDNIVSGDNFLFEKDSSQFRLNKQGEFYSPTNSVIALNNLTGENFHYINNQKVIARNDKAGLRELIIRNDSLLEGKRFFEDEFFSYVAQDNDGVLYLGTFGEGIKVIPVYQQKKIELDGELKSICITKRNELFVNTRSGILYRYKNQLIEKREIDPNTNRVFETNFGIGNDFQRLNNIVYESENRFFSSLKDVYSVNDSTFLYVDNVTAGIVSKTNQVPDNFNVFKTTTSGISFIRYQNNERFKAVASNDISKNVLVAGNNGVFNLVTGKEFTIKGVSVFANDLAFFEDVLIIGTKSQGVWLVKDSQIIQKIDLAEGLLSNEIIKIKLVDDQLYVLCSVGLQKYSLKNNSLYTFGIKDGVFSDRIKGFDANSRSIWVLEKNSFYPVSIPSFQADLTFDVDSIFVGDKLINADYKNSFVSSDNSLRIRLSNSNIVTSSESYYRYFLEGFDESPKQINSQQSVIVYPFLPPGSYSFKISLSRGEKSSEEYRYNFTIPLPFYRQWWFVFLLLLVVVFSVVLFMRMRFKKIAKKNKEALEKEIMAKSLLDSELKALRSQMNPHFMFNSLNSIQNLILKEEVDKAYDYVVTFSELVRNTLNYSQEEFIDVQKEVDFLEVYLKLEKLRFKKDFNYKIENTVPQNIQIPSLLIQPFIENSLKHGLLHKEGLKDLSVKISYSDKVICTVRDNGIGRIKAEKLKNNKSIGHTSFAMDSIAKRLQILSARYGEKFYYQVNDLMENGQSAGTKIEINLPFKRIENPIS